MGGEDGLKADSKRGIVLVVEKLQSVWWSLGESVCVIKVTQKYTYTLHQCAFPGFTIKI
jgi:hypothetical protein